MVMNCITKDSWNARRPERGKGRSDQTRQEGTSGKRPAEKRLGPEVKLKSAPELFGFKPLVKGFEANAEVIDVVDGRFLVLTDRGAPRWRVVVIDPADPSPENWVDLIPQMENETIQTVRLVGGKLFVVTLKDVASHVYQYNLQGQREKEIELPTYGTVSGFTGRRDDPYTFFSFTSFTYPTTIYFYDISSGKAEPYFTAARKPQFKPEDYECKQVFYASKRWDKGSLCLLFIKKVFKGMERIQLIFMDMAGLI